MTLTVFDRYGYVYDIMNDYYAAQAVARQIGGYVMDDEGNRF